MKTKPLATAILLGLAGLHPVAYAGDGPASNTTIYGAALLSIDSLNDGDDSAAFLSSNGSVLGIKGSEDLGNGMALIFQLEGDVDWDGGNTAFGATSESFIGLEGGAGTFLAGNLLLSDQWGDEVNLFADLIGDARNILPGVPDILPNALYYASPDLNGVNLALTWVADEGADEDLWGAHLAWENGPLLLAATHFQIENDNGTETALTGRYDFDGFGIVAGWVKHNDKFTDFEGRNAWTLGATADVGGGTAKIQFIEAGKVDGDAGSKARMWAAGYDYSLSERTTVYAAWASVENDTGAEYSMSEHADAAGPGRDPSGFSLGLIHEF